MRIDLIEVPYDSGHRSVRMGRGPERLTEAGLTEHLRALGHDVVPHVVETTLAFPAEAAIAFDLARAISARVRAARAVGRFPLILAGNCMSAVGVVAGLGDGAATGVVWLDAHGDFNTPETSTSAFLDGMAGAVLVGRCWKAAAGSVPGFRRVPETSFLLIGARDLDPPETELLVGSRVTVLDATAVRTGEPLIAALRQWSAVRGVYLHVDLDVLDPDRVGTANSFVAPGGLTLDDVRGVIRGIRSTHGIAAATVSAYDPSQDAGGRIAIAAFGIIDEIVAAVSP